MLNQPAGTFWAVLKLSVLHQTDSGGHLLCFPVLRMSFGLGGKVRDASPAHSVLGRWWYVMMYLLHVMCRL